MYLIFNEVINEYCSGFRWDSTNLQNLCDSCLPGWKIKYSDRKSKRNGSNGAASVNNVKNLYELITDNEKRFCYSLSASVLAKVIVDLWKIKNNGLE